MPELGAVVLFFFICITTVNNGFFTLPGFIFLIISTICVYVLFFTSVRKVQVQESLLVYLLIISSSLFLYFNGGIYTSEFRPTLIIKYLSLFVFPVIVTYIMPISTLQSRSKAARFFILFLCAGILRIGMILASPTPAIDVFYMLSEAPVKLLSGENPYTAVYSPVYPHVIPDYFTYWPAAFLLQLPFVKFLGDPRYLLVLADLVCAYLIYLTGRKKYAAEVLALLYLYRPNALYIIEQSWLASLELMCMIMPLYLLQHHPKMKYGTHIVASLMSVLTAIKPMYVIPSIFMFIATPRRSAYSFIYLLMLSLLVIPFFVWDTSAFVKDTIDFFTRLPGEMPSVPVYLSLNVNTFIHSLIHTDVPRFIFTAINTITVCVLTCYAVISSSRYVVLKASIVFLLVFYVCNYFTFINYYYMLTGMLIYYISSSQYTHDDHA